jgi:hypothetical protein
MSLLYATSLMSLADRNALRSKFVGLVSSYFSNNGNTAQFDSSSPLATIKQLHPETPAINGSAWSEEEDQRLRAMYPSVDGLEVLNAFPEDTWFVLCRRGEKLGIRRSVADNIPIRSTYLLNI